MRRYIQLRKQREVNSNSEGCVWFAEVLLGIVAGTVVVAIVLASVGADVNATYDIVVAFIVADGAAVQTPDTEIIVQEEQAKAFVFDPGVSLTDIVDAINAVGATPSDLVAILEALKVSGALRAQLIII